MAYLVGNATMRRTRYGIAALGAQAAASVSNLLLTVLIARATTPQEFAAFALTLPTYIVIQRIWRVHVLIPHQIETNRSASFTSPSPPISSAVAVPIALGPLLLLLGVIAGDPYLPWVVLLASSLPLLAAYDAVRNTALTHRRADVAARMDLAWLAMQSVFSAIVLVGGLPPLLHGAAWALPPGLIALATIALWVKSKIEWRLTRHNQTTFTQRALDTATDVFSSVLVAQSIPYIIALTVGSTTGAAFRAAQTLTGPMNVIVMGLLPLLQNATAIRVDRPRSVVRVTNLAVLGLTGAAAIYALALSQVPNSLGTELLGATWQEAETLIVGVALLMVARTPFLAITTSFRSLGLIRTLSAIRACNSIGLTIAALLASLYATPPFIAMSMAFIAATTGIASYSILGAVSKSTREPDRRIAS